MVSQIMKTSLIITSVAKRKEIIPKATQAAAEADPPQLQESHQAAQEGPPQGESRKVWNHIIVYTRILP